MKAPVKILYVEDEPHLGKIVRESLESRGFAVRQVADGRLVTEAFRQFQPDLVVLDVMLPHKDGFTLGRELRTLDARLPILFLTAKTQTEDVLEGFRSGGNDYLKKPFSLEELIARIRNLLHLTGEERTDPEKRTLRIGRFTFHPLRYELHFEGQVRKLSHREAELLRILAENRNRVVERRRILHAIWGDDSIFNSRNLDVYITRLRDCLKADPAVRIITLKGVGYRFVVD
ncbi:MAG: DNA-binding response regulator [Bacteroidetes bacterium]|nr:MAG: DNA-binding response regulator [Bacteroidota bacterium]